MADLAALFSVRKKKLKALRDAGVEPYPEDAPPHASVGAILKNFEHYTGSAKTVGVAGRIAGLRGHGGAIFADIRDASASLQVFLARDALGARSYRVAEGLDLGDFAAVRGTAMRTRRGEPTIRASRLTILAKSLRPLPSERFRLRGVEERFRNREVDLALDAGVAERFRIRSKSIRALRQGLERKGFLEVETPILQSVPGGASAEPFRTALRALRMPLYLRIAPELYLKRLLVGGFEKVFEIGRVFRNEGMDQTHNPEFTMLEFYWAYQNLEGLAAFSERFLRAAVLAATGRETATFREKVVDFGKPFARVRFADLFEKHFSFHPIGARRSALREAAKTWGIPLSPSATDMVLADRLFKKAIVPRLIAPTFVLFHPLALSPLAKASRVSATCAARFQIFAGGLELANAYAELNDPEEQRRRFVEESRRAHRGDREAQRLDDDFLRALEYGMPPAAGFGLGIDRFVMLLTDAPSMREVLLFPTMRPKRDRLRTGRTRRGHP